MASLSAPSQPQTSAGAETQGSAITVTETQGASDVRHYHVRQTEGTPIMFDAAMRLLADGDPTMLDLMPRTLRNSPFRAFFWECPPVSADTVSSTPFEFVLVDSPGEKQQ